MDKKNKKKKDMNFQSMDSLKQVTLVLNEASEALKDKKRTMIESAISEVLVGALGAGLGTAGSFTALYSLGTVGLSGPGIMSGLAAAGKGVSVLLGGAVSASVAGIFVLATPIAVLAATGVGVTAHVKSKNLMKEKEILFQEAIKKQNAIINALKKENDANKKRVDYLTSLNILLERIVRDLRSDLEYAV